MKETHLPPSSIEGNWRLSYFSHQNLFAPDTEVDDQGTVNLESGIVSGSDAFGGIYLGDYSLDGDKFSATVVITSNSDKKSKPVFWGLKFPYILELSGQYSSPDFFSATGKVVGRPEFEIIINCRRLKTPV